MSTFGRRMDQVALEGRVGAIERKKTGRERIVVGVVVMEHLHSVSHALP